MKKIFLFCGIPILLYFAFTNDPVLELTQRFENYHQIFKTEKVYLHTDKPYYTAGENIWLKAYAVTGPNEIPDTLSVPLYVELIDLQANKVTDQRILRMTYGYAAGDFQLADTLRPGFYQLRAYTNWMRNLGDNSFFKKNIQVFEQGKAAVPAIVKDRNINFEFFPEGGDLVDGLENRLAFKATDASGKGVAITGSILNTDRNVVARFESRHQGMGYVMFKPDKNEQYTVNVTANNIIEFKALLPKILPSGYGMAVDNLSNPDKIKVYIHQSANLPVEPVHIIAQSHGVVHFSGKINLSANSGLVQIPKNQLPAGVNQLTLIDHFGNPHCERLIYLNNYSAFVPTLNTPKVIRKVREKVDLQLQVKDESGKPVQGNFSLVVSDTSFVKFNKNAENIKTYFQLTSEVSGYVEDPAQYFDKSDTFSAINLDILLMTQGWRRFSWRDIKTTNVAPPQFEVEKGLKLSGEITRSTGKMAKKNIAVSLMLKDYTDEIAILTTDADENGNFLFPDLSFQDSVKVLVQAVEGRNRRNTSVYVDSIASPKIQIVRIPYTAVEFASEDLDEFLKRTQEAIALEQKIRMDKAILLEEVVVNAKREDDFSNGRVLYRDADASIQVAGNNLFNGYMNVLDLLRGRIAGVQVLGGVMDPTVIIRGAANFSGAVEPLFLLDGMPVDKSLILTIPVMDVEKIDVLKGPSAAIYGSRGGGGVVSVITKRGDSDKEWSNEAAPGIITFVKKGFYTAREFYVPKYDQDLLANRQPDYRSTVYWNPNITTDENGEATVSFFSTDAHDTQFILQLEGMAFTGDPVVGKWAIDVR